MFVMSVDSYLITVSMFIDAVWSCMCVYRHGIFGEGLELNELRKHTMMSVLITRLHRPANFNFAKVVLVLMNDFL
jgi:hypothetical protein